MPYAVAGVREMLVAMDDINRASHWSLQIGIGIHFGELVTGNIRSLRPMKYTMIGDAVNFATRLESLNSWLLIFGSGSRHAGAGRNQRGVARRSGGQGL